MIEKCFLGDIAKSQTGPFGSQLHEEDYVSDGTPIVTVEHLGELGFTTQNLPFVSDEDVARLNKYTLKEGDIVFSRVGAIDRNTYVTQNEDGWMFSGRCIRVRCDKSKVNPLYLSYYFRLDSFKRMMLNVSVGATMPSLNTDIMNELPLELVERSEQDRIAECLSTIDDKIRNNNTICSNLESMAKLLYDYWFVQFDFPDENGKPYKSSGGKMVWNEELKREIPEDFKAVSLLNLCDVIDCLHSKKPDYNYENENCYLLSLENIKKEGYIDTSNRYYISESDYEYWTQKVTAQEDDFVVTNAGRAGDIGKIPSGIKCAIGRNITLIRPKSINSDYLRQFFKSLYLKQQVISSLAAGSFFSSFNVYAIKNLSILMPTGSVYGRYIDAIAPLITKIEMLQAENQQLTELSNFLLPMLMNGQVKIKEKEDN